MAPRWRSHLRERTRMIKVMDAMNTMNAMGATMGAMSVI